MKKTKIEELKEEIKQVENNWKDRDNIKWSKRNTQWFELRAELKGRQEERKELMKKFEKIIIGNPNQRQMLIKLKEIENEKTRTIKI